MRAQLLIVSLLLNGCATPTQIVGPYAAHLSDADIQQIKLLISKDPEIEHSVAQIEAIRPDKAWVEVGGPNPPRDGSRYTKFRLLKRDGQWIHDPNSPVEVESVVVTY